MLASGLVEQGFESTWGQVLAFFPPFCLFFTYSKTHTIFFRFSDLVICGFLVWPDYVRTAAAVIIMYQVPFYSSTINTVLIIAVGRQVSGFEPPLPCFRAFHSLFFRYFSGWMCGLMGA